MQIHTDRMDTHKTHMDTDVVPLSHFELFVADEILHDMYAKDTNFILWHATDIHMHKYTIHMFIICRDISTYRYRQMHTDIHKHTCRHHRHTHAYFLHTQTHMHVCQVNSACSFYI